MEVICLQETAFFALVEEVVGRLKEKYTAKGGDKWLSQEEAMAKLKITSKSTLQALRDNSEITYSQPNARFIVYDADSIDEYFNRHLKKKL